MSNNCIWCKSIGPHIGPCSVSRSTNLITVEPMEVYEDTIIKMSQRIAELEAEVERLKAQDEMTYPEALKALQEMAESIQQEEIKQQSATDFEEGEG